MITYEEALGRFQFSPVKRDINSVTTWQKYLVGTPEFWEVIDHGILAGHETANGDYVGVVTDFYADDTNATTIWIWVKPDPTGIPLPEGQQELPVAFGMRDEIWLETV